MYCKHACIKTKKKRKKRKGNKLKSDVRVCPNCVCGGSGAQSSEADQEGSAVLGGADADPARVSCAQLALTLPAAMVPT